MMLFLCSCSFSEIRFEKKHKGIDSELMPYVQYFIEASKGKVTQNDLKDITIGFHDYPNDSLTVGTCHYIPNEIDISRKWWKHTYSTPNKLTLMFHELGHCVLKRGHVGDSNFLIEVFEEFGIDMDEFKSDILLGDGCPKSIMYDKVLPEICMNTHFDTYMKELFNH
jgi:hypothetical protein